MFKRKDKNLMKVLVVEQDDYNIRVKDSFLYACGYANVVFARNSTEALEQFTCEIDLVLLNISLPNFSGVELCKQLRQMSGGKKVPIVAFVPKGKTIQKECLKVGVSDVMRTPTSFNGFKSMMQRSLG